MKEIKENSIFLSLWLLTALALSIAIGMVDKAELHLALCDHHTAWADAIMPVLSDLVNWLPYVVAVAFLIWRWRTGVFMASGLILSTLLVQAVKRLVCAPRPLTWFAENHPDITLPLTDGVKMNYYLSFPSGHTTTFFCLFFALCVIGTKILACSQLQTSTKCWLGVLVQLICFALAAVCSYSRIYLSQHFATDILGGMIIGVLSVLIVIAIFLLCKSDIIGRTKRKGSAT